MTDNALVNIIIPTYNYGNFIVDALDSAVNQTYNNVQVTILDNKSTDDTYLKINPYLKKYKYINYVNSNKNIGLVANLNKGLILNSCKYVTYLAADDILNSCFIEECLKKIQKYDTAIVASGEEVINESKRHLYYMQHDDYPYYRDARWFFMKNVHGPALSGVLINANYVSELKLFFKTKYRFCPEVDFWLRLSHFHGFYYIRKVMFKKRLHGKNDSYIKSNKNRVIQWCNCIDTFLNDFQSTYKDNPIRFNAYVGCALFCLRYGKKSLVIKYVKKTFTYLSLNTINYRFITLIFFLLLPIRLWRYLIRLYDHFVIKIPPDLILSN